MNTNDFYIRHIGLSNEDLTDMLNVIGVNSVEDLLTQTLPDNIRIKNELDLPEPMSEREYADHILELASRNKLFTSYIGQGWYDTVLPAVIQRNVLENPVWYTSYTPYQAEISQGRLEALFNFQSVITDLTGLPLSNCSLLDEATAGAEAVLLMYNERSRLKVKSGANKLFVDDSVFISTYDVIKTRAQCQGIDIIRGSYTNIEFTEEYFGAVVQFPNADGKVVNYKSFIEQCHAKDIKVSVASDILSMVLLTPAGELGADIVFGSSQRFGIPMYYGGPSAGYIACRMEYKRNLPGRIIGKSKDRLGNDAYRLALQTREQHIKREKATSNICTAQALLASMAGFYAIYHGAKGLKTIAMRVHSYAGEILKDLELLGYKVVNKNIFDTLLIELPSNIKQDDVKNIALDCSVNLYYRSDGKIQLSVDETTDLHDIGILKYIFATAIGKDILDNDREYSTHSIVLDRRYLRKSSILEYEVFNKYHTETEMMRYIKRLERKDISLAHSMISLGSCTMKLNAASEVIPLSNPYFCNLHPYVPHDQVEGTLEILDNLKLYLSKITGLPHVCLQPNSGAAGEYAGLRTIHSYFEANNNLNRNIIVLPASAHGTNPASASQCGYKTIVVKCDENGNVDWNDFMEKTEIYKDNIAAMMITYPSTHGIFENNIIDLCNRIHEIGAFVYMDGANMNAQVGFTNPGCIGADICHLNLHKTFSIPHGGGGPGSGPICMNEDLYPYMPSHNFFETGNENSYNSVSSSPYGSAGIDIVSYGYIRMLGAKGLKKCTETAIVNANYMATKLKDTYGIVYLGATGRVGHELILDCRHLKSMSGIDETDIAKRLIDFGYHAPTLSFPVHGTLMIEPTESESKREIDKFLSVMDCIWNEIQEIKYGIADKNDNVLKNAPHPEREIVSDVWEHPYSREKAAYALPYLKEDKFWINVARIDNGLGDRNLIPSFCCLLAVGS